jgi:hypothetical protein
MGVKKGISDTLAALGEIGYGYYGKTTFNFHQDGPILSSPEAPDFSQATIKAMLDGLDVLAGFSYQLQALELSVKAGALIENARYNPRLNLSRLASGSLYGSASLDSNVTQVLPEIKVGAAYQIGKNLSLTAAWMHIFGESPSINITINPNFPPGTIAINTQNPTLEAVILGARYTFSV